MEINLDADPTVVAWQSVFKILTGSIVPRPIGWISTLDEKNRPNLAPFSFFNVVCANPPHVLFCPGIRAADSHEKDTLRNVRSTREFVVNIVTEALAPAMNLTSTELPEEVDEFELAGLARLPSVLVRPPRVAQSPIHYECRVAHIVDIGDYPGSGSIVVGRVVHIHVADEVLLGEDKINLERLQPVGRLAGASYCRVTDTFELTRPASQVKRRSE